MKFYQYLLEKRLMSEFTFGYELECFSIRDYPLDKNKVKDILDEYFTNSDNFVVSKDGSIKPDYDDITEEDFYDWLYHQQSTYDDYVEEMESKLDNEYDEYVNDMTLEYEKQFDDEYDGDINRLSYNKYKRAIKIWLEDNDLLDNYDTWFWNNYMGEFPFDFEDWFQDNMRNYNINNIDMDDLDLIKDYEIKSPVLSFTPKNINEITKFLNSMNDVGLYTNKTCGFHVHVSFPGINEKDMIWIISHLSLDKNMIKTITKFKKYDFFNDEYADKDYLIYIEHSIKNKTFDFDFDDKKYNLIRLHPQGTLEWRGPRDFLNNINLREIKDFFKLLYKFISWMNRIMDKKTIDGISKEEYFDNVNFKEFLKKNTKRDPRFSIYQDKKTIEKVFKKFPWINKLTFNNVIMDIIKNKLVFKSGEIIRGTWRNGIWENGIWHNGIWEYGTWNNGTWKGGNWYSGKWENGIWHNGTWRNGIWENGTWKNGIWYDGTWKDGTWEDGTWKNGTWEDGTWEDGYWYNGTWEDGYWYNGIWKNGYWRGGVIFSKKFKEHVESSINPKEFYKLEKRSKSLKELKEKVS